MAKGGARTGAGRKKGGHNRFRKELAAKIKTAEEIIGDGFTPLDFLVQMMRDEKIDSDVRVDAAKAAAPYVHKRQPQDSNVNISGRVEAVLIKTPLTQRP